jgi:uncharacterized membrane protein YhhN
MPRRALAEKRPWLLASLAAAVSYYVMKDSAVPGLYLMVWKGAGVALLAIYALLRHGGADSRMMAAIMAFGALGDVAMEVNEEAGAALFFIGHLIAIALYLRHRRDVTTGSQKAAALVLLLGVPLIAWLLPADRSAAMLTALYGLSLGGMAAAAWTSTFSRYRVGMGAVLFVMSDVLIFARMGPLADSTLPGLAIWPLYYFGQFLICIGVINTLRQRAER